MMPEMYMVDILREKDSVLEVLLLFIGLLWNRTMLSFVFFKSDPDGVLQIKKATTKYSNKE